ncbi:MAG: energy coupling factor transporter S component ThiW [Clostridiales bacterium]|nr:energy coupling factor transporter S component ThiW [Clostridiales bacterium]
MNQKTNKTSQAMLKMIMLAMLVAIGVVISPILRVEGMCPMAHLINIVCAVLLGPWYSLLCAVLIGILRMLFMGIPPLALTGAVFGAFLSGVLYRASKGKLIFAVIGEVIGTGIIGAIVSYPVMTFLWGREGLTAFFYIPSFISGTLIGGAVAFIFLKELAKNKLLGKFQQALGSKVCEGSINVWSDSIGIAFLGIIGYLAVLVLRNRLNFKGIAFYAPHIILVLFVAFAVIYLIINKKTKKESPQTN